MKDNAQFSLENRQSSREVFNIPVKLEVSEEKSDAAKVFLGYTSNLSQHGIGLNIVPGSVVYKDKNLIVNIDAQDHLQTFKLPAKVMWHSDSRCGLQFLEKFENIQEFLQKAATGFRVQNPKLRKFYPYIDGEDVDTGNYEFLAYPDRLILDSKKTREMISQLRRGYQVPGVEEYVYAQYAVVGSDTNRRAIYSAHQAFLEFRQYSIERRRMILDRARELMLREKDQLIQLLMIEGRPRRVADWEYQSMLSVLTKESLDYFQKEMVQTVEKNSKETIVQVRRPRGVVCILEPQSASTMSFLCGLSLLTGNTLVIKPSMQMPLSSIYVWRNIYGRAIKLNGAPKGVVNVILGSTSQILDEWVHHISVRCILSFGDRHSERDIGKKTFGSGKKSHHGTFDSEYMVIWKDAPLEKAAESLLDGFMGSSQLRMIPKKAIIHEDAYEKFVQIFLEKVRSLKIGLPSDPETILSPVLNISEFFNHLVDSIQNGANLLTGGYRVNHYGAKDNKGSFIAPTVLEVQEENAGVMKCIKEENMFPLIPLVRVSGGEQTQGEMDKNIFRNIMKILNLHGEGLRTSVWVRDPLYLRKFIENVQDCGMLKVNARHVSLSHHLSEENSSGLSEHLFGELGQIWQVTSHLQGVSISHLELDRFIKPFDYK